MKKTNFNKDSQLAAALSSVDIHAMLMEKAKTAVLATAVELMAQDIDRLCGDAFARKSEGLCHRGGSELTSVVIDGARHSIRKPRARKDGKEVDLPSVACLRDQELLDAQMLQRILRGVSTRNYEGVINGFAEKTGISKSSVSRAFTRSSRKDLDEINSSDLSKYSFVAIMIDGTGHGATTQVVAVGITRDNEKIPLGLKQGDTENAEVVKDLLSSIESRGFKFSGSRILAVLDGGKALRSAVKALWGDAVLIQRCWLHKLRNIQEYIPKTNHRQLWFRMKRMMTLNDFHSALKEFHLIKSWLAEISFDAEKSFLEAGEELLTVHKLGLVGTYRNSLSSTNIIESLIGIVKSKTRGVKNWGYHPKTKSKVERDKALRWMATAIQSHRSKLRRLKGGTKQIEIFIAALNKVDTMKKAA